MISKFFIERPVLSNVIAILMIVIGAVSLYSLAVAQYPDVVPPTVQVTTRYPGASLTAISESVLLYRVSGRLIYRNDLIGGCTGLGRGDTLIIKPTGSQYCRGDIARSADLAIGSITGGCALGSFTPYRTPGR